MSLWEQFLNQNLSSVFPAYLFDTTGLRSYRSYFLAVCKLFFENLIVKSGAVFRKRVVIISCDVAFSYFNRLKRHE